MLAVLDCSPVFRLAESPLALDQRQVAQVFAITIEQVEGDKHRPRSMPLVQAGEVQHWAGGNGGAYRAQADALEIEAAAKRSR